MLLNLIDFLSHRQFIGLYEWACAILDTKGISLAESEYVILKSIKNRQLPELIESIRRFAYTQVKNEPYSLILQLLEENQKDIIQQWLFLSTVRKEAPFVNVVHGHDIWIYQPHPTISKKQVASMSFDQLQTYLLDESTLLTAGELFSIIGLSSIDKLNVEIHDTNLMEDYQRYQKYEKIIQFIEKVDEPLQKLFSLNQIGIVIYQDEILLIKWVQFIDENQLLFGETNHRDNVAILENFGVKIGVQLKDNLELGDVMVFRNEDPSSMEHTEKSSPLLRPLLSLEQSFFTSDRRRSHPKQYDLSDPQQSEMFVHDVLARIETGILLLTKSKEGIFQSSKELDLYIKISIEKIEGIPSVNQRLSLLRDLLKINRNPDNVTKIVEKLETNYLLFVKEQIQIKNSTNLPSIILTLHELGLFSESISILVYTLVYLFESHYVDDAIILKTVESLENHWKLDDELNKLLEKPQIIALTNTIIKRMETGKFNDIIQFLTKYISDHPKLQSYNLITLLIRILVDLFQKYHDSATISFPNTKYLSFFDEFLKFLTSQDSKFTNENKLAIAMLLQENILYLSMNLDFLAYLNEKVYDFLTVLYTLSEKSFINTPSSAISPVESSGSYLPPRIYFRILHNIVEHSHLVIFHKILPVYAQRIFKLFQDQKTEFDLVIEYIYNYIDFIIQSTNILKENIYFTKNILDLLSEMKKWLDVHPIKPVFLLPLKKRVAALLSNWYLEGGLPELPFTFHSQLLTQWVEFASMEKHMQEMLDLLYIKQFAWVFLHFDLDQMVNFYNQLPSTVFTDRLDRFLAEIQILLKTHFVSLTQFQVVNTLFNFLKNDYQRFLFTPQEFRVYVSLYISTLQSSLLQLVKSGNNRIYQEIVTEIKDNFFFLSMAFLNTLYQQLTSIFEMNSNEGNRFIARDEMSKTMVLVLEIFLSNYDLNLPNYQRFCGAVIPLMSKADITTFLEMIKIGSMKIFTKMQEWLLVVCVSEYLRSAEVLKPAKIFFADIITRQIVPADQIFEDLKHVCKEIFANQPMLIDNKKKFFQMMKEIINKDKYRSFATEIDDFLVYLDELSDIESLYYTMRQNDPVKAESLRKRLKKLLEKYDQLFSPWAIYGNVLLVQEKYDEALDAFREALKYRSNQPNYSRLFHNNLVILLVKKKYTEAVELIKNLELGIKTYPYIARLIRSVEDITGIHLLGEENVQENEK